MIFEELPGSPPDVDVDWDATGRGLKARPNEWGRVAVYPSRGSAATVAYQINRGLKHPTLFRHGRFEAKSRTVDGEFRLYVRWLHS